MGIKKLSFIEKLNARLEDRGDLLEYRIIVDAFRQCGFLQVLADRIINVKKKDVYKENFISLLDEINKAIERRKKPNPINDKEISTRFDMEVETMYLIESKLGQLLQNAKAKEQSVIFQHMYEGFIASANRITEGALPYIVKHNDSLIREHGTILLKSQGLMIQVGAMSDRLGLHQAYISPKKSFGHIHSKDLAEKPNWEYHFVYPGNEGSHVVQNYRCNMDKVNGDIVAVPINQPHGGFNHAESPMELHFCAGGDIAWDFPPTDLETYDVENSEYVHDLKLLNGLPLESILNKADQGIQTILNPITLGGDYGIELQSLVLDGKSFRFTSPGEVAQVWFGQGILSVVGTEMKSFFSKGDKFALLSGIEYEIKPQHRLILLKFIMKDFKN